MYRLQRGVNAISDQCMDLFHSAERSLKPGAILSNPVEVSNDLNRVMFPLMETNFEIYNKEIDDMWAAWKHANQRSPKHGDMEKLYNKFKRLAIDLHALGRRRFMKTVYLARKDAVTNIDDIDLTSGFMFTHPARTLKTILYAYHETMIGQMRVCDQIFLVFKNAMEFFKASLEGKATETLVMFDVTKVTPKTTTGEIQWTDRDDLKMHTEALRDTIVRSHINYEITKRDELKVEHYQFLQKQLSAINNALNPSAVTAYMAGTNALFVDQFKHNL